LIEYENNGQVTPSENFNNSGPQYVDQSQLVYYNHTSGMQPPNYHPNEVQEYNQYAIKMNEYQKNIALKSSNDFQERNHYLKSSNDFINHQRPWENYFQSNNMEYNNDGFFVENNFL